MQKPATALAVAFGVILAVTLALAGPASAEHAFSHRVHIVGRVLDVDGQPAPGLPVTVAFTNVTVHGACYDAKDERTGPTGDYALCRHVHALPLDGRVNVSVGGASRDVAIDPELRHATANLRLPTPRAARDLEGDLAFARTLLVAGRAYTLLPEPTNEEGVVVNATPIGGNVSVELRVAGEVVAQRNGSANEHGDFAVKLDVGAIPAGALVRVRMGTDGSEAPVDPTWRRVDTNVVRDLRLFAGLGEDAPGSARTPFPEWAALMALAGVSLAVAARRPRSPR